MTTTPTPAPAPFTVFLVARQSYDPIGNLRLNPRIDVLTSAGTTSIVEAYESYMHLSEIASALNTDCEATLDKIQTEGVSEDADPIIDIGSDDDDDDQEEDADVVGSFAEIFDADRHPFLIGLPINVHNEGYSSVSVYVRVVHGDVIRVTAPDTFDELSKTHNEVMELNLKSKASTQVMEALQHFLQSGAEETQPDSATEQ